MTFVSVAEACRRLGIDAKTLRRWLANAQLPLQGHPRDGRKKGVSSDHLQQLACLHHRHLTPLAQEPPAPHPDDLSQLSATLLALPEQLSALQAQISALEQHVADLTHLMRQHEPEPAIALGSTKPSSTAKLPPKPTRSALRSRPAASPTAKTPPKPTHVIPRVEYGDDGGYVVICPKHGLLPFEPETPEWFAWVAEQDSFRFVGQAGHFTAHHEWRVPKGAWRAYRQIRNHVYIHRLAPNQELTLAVLEQAAATLQAHLSE
jgi:transposase-like protein